MRRILIDRARSKQAIQHGGGLVRVDAEEVEIVAPAEEKELLDVHQVLDEFALQHKDKAELVKLRYFAGLTLPRGGGGSLASASQQPSATGTFARMWLFREICRRKEAKRNKWRRRVSSRREQAKGRQA
jgi:hypothetical protein